MTSAKKRATVLIFSDNISAVTDRSVSRYRTESYDAGIGYLSQEDWREFVLIGGVSSWRYENLDVNVLKEVQEKFLK